MFSTVLAVALAIVTTADAPITYDDQRTNIQYPLVHQVLCKEGAGTAFRIGPTRFASVAHVTAMHECTIDGYPIKVVEQDTEHDFSLLEAGPPKGGALKISCEGYKTSEWYWSTGYAYGLPHQTNVAIYSSAFDDTFNHERIFIGRHTVIPGMSGGPVFNSRHEVVGTVNMYAPIFGLSMSRALKDTSVCKKTQEGAPANARAPQVADSL